MSELVFQGVSKSLEGQSVLANFTARLPTRGVTFVVGRSGAGKSVLCRLAVGLLRADAGAIELLGQRVDRLGERELERLRARAPYLVQGPALLDWLPVLDNVALPLRGRPDATDRARAALDRLGLTPFERRLPTELGPGIRKRAAIARALVLEPELLILDEPTTGLDRIAAAQVNEAIAALRQMGLGALVVSHDYRALGELADRVLVVSAGAAAFLGTPDELARSSLPEVQELLNPNAGDRLDG